MSEYTEKPTDQDCTPKPDPGQQPPQTPDCNTNLPTTTAPTPPKPPECKNPCCCPHGPAPKPNCLEDLIQQQAEEIAKAEKAKQFKTELEALLTKAQAASQDYTRATYDRLVKDWKEQDEAIVDIIQKVVCGVPCWECVIECYICPILNEMRDAEWHLYDDEKLYETVSNYYDVLYWHQQDRDVKERRFNRIKSVLAAWEKPAQTIEKILGANNLLIGELKKALDSPNTIFDLFLKLIPQHLAIAPAGTPSKIDAKYTAFCKCDTGEPDNCCIRDAGMNKWSLRKKWLGPQPYLVDPQIYIDIICCLVKHRYAPAQEALADAEAAVLTAENDIKRAKAIIENGLKNFEKNAKGAIPLVIDCEKHKPKPTPPTTTY
jgi:hypothetical protein